MRLGLKEWLNEYIVHASFHRCILERLLGISSHAAYERLAICNSHAAYYPSCRLSVAHWHAIVHEDQAVIALTRFQAGLHKVDGFHPIIARVTHHVELEQEARYRT